jgi:hypothetical protein
MTKLMVAAATALAACTHVRKEIDTIPAVIVNSATPVLFADRIEPSLASWEKLGFTRTRDVPAGDHLAFAIVARGDVEIMYQTLESAADEGPEMRQAAASGKTFLYVQVPSLAAVRDALSGTRVFLEERKTFYGATEIGYVEPAGHFVTFAQFDSP